MRPIEQKKTQNYDFSADASVGRAGSDALNERTDSAVGRGPRVPGMVRKKLVRPVGGSRQTVPEGARTG